MDEKARSVLEALGLLDAPTIVLPTGGTGLGGGFVAPLYAGYYYATSIEGEKLDIAEAAVAARMGTWGWQYFFADQDVADALHSQNGGEYGATPVHAVFFEKANMLNSTEAIESGFADVIVGSVVQRTLQSKTYRHQYHMIALPSLVHAAAQAIGYDVPEFDLSELTQQDHVLNINRDELTEEQTAEIDQLWIRLCGNSDAKVGEEGHYQQSAYWLQRAALWKALGESNTEACHRKADNDRFSTQSDQLDSCLQIALANWSTPVWGRMRLVRDPKPDAFSSSGNRVSLGIVTQLYASEADAQASVGDGSESTVANAPALPQGYADLGEGGLETWTSEIQRTKGIAPAIAAQQVGTDVAEVVAWREHLGL